MNYGQGDRFTVVCGAESLEQYAPVTIVGAYATTFSDQVLDFYGINQEKPQPNDHFAVVVRGETKARLATASSVGDLMMVAGSGYLSPVNSGYHAVGRVVFQADSGGIANVYLFGGPRYYNGT